MFQSNWAFYQMPLSCKELALTYNGHNLSSNLEIMMMLLFMGEITWWRKCCLYDKHVWAVFRSTAASFNRDLCCIYILCVTVRRKYIVELLCLKKFHIPCFLRTVILFFQVQRKFAINLEFLLLQEYGERVVLQDSSSLWKITVIYSLSTSYGMMSVSHCTQLQNDTSFTLDTYTGNLHFIV